MVLHSGHPMDRTGLCERFQSRKALGLFLSWWLDTVALRLTDVSVFRGAALDGAKLVQNRNDYWSKVF